jgi:hypothetical protein
VQHAEAMDAAENVESVEMARCALQTRAFALVNAETLSAELTAAEQKHAVIALRNSHASAACVKSFSRQRQRRRQLQPRLEAIYPARSTAWAMVFAISRQELAIAALDSFLQAAALITTHWLSIATLTRERAHYALPRLPARGALTLRRLDAATLRRAMQTIRFPAALQARLCSRLVAALTTASAMLSRLKGNA